jgi:uncharacterized damage-inducible protein DinB
MLQHFAMMAGYNAWANKRLYEACGALSEQDRRAGLGAFFGSLHGTLSHLLVADRIWLARFAGQPAPHAALDETPWERFADLRAAREAEDARIEAFVAALTPEALEGVIAYAPITRPIAVRQTLGSALAHVFNHQTHHRGQCHAMLTRVAQVAPPLDLIYFQRDTGVGLAV